MPISLEWLRLLTAQQHNPVSARRVDHRSFRGRASHIEPTLKIFFLLIYAVVVLHAQAPDQPLHPIAPPKQLGRGTNSVREREEKKQRNLDFAQNSIVVLTGDLQGGTVLAAGIVVGKDSEQIYVITANHVVRRNGTTAKNLRIATKRKPDKMHSAILLPRFDTRLDLGVIAVPGVTTDEIDVCSDLRVLLPPEEDSPGRGAQVWAVGNPNGNAWLLPLWPDGIVKRDPDRIIFQSATLSVGHAGGGLFTEGGSLIAMIISEKSPFGAAVPIGRIREGLKGWEIPTQLRIGYQVLPPEIVPTFEDGTPCKQ